MLEGWYIFSMYVYKYYETFDKGTRYHKKKNGGENIIQITRLSKKSTIDMLYGWGFERNLIYINE